MVDLTDEIKNKLELVLANVDKLDFGDKNIIPLVNDYHWEDYSWDSSFFGITKDGKIGYIFESGCSCDGPSWYAEDGEEPEDSDLTKKTLKGLELDIKDFHNYYETFDVIEINSKLDEIIKENGLR